MLYFPWSSSAWLRWDWSDGGVVVLDVTPVPDSEEDGKLRDELEDSLDHELEDDILGDELEDDTLVDELEHVASLLLVTSKTKINDLSMK
jgi:hypothetical protein